MTNYFSRILTFDSIYFDTLLFFIFAPVRKSYFDFLEGLLGEPINIDSHDLSFFGILLFITCVIFQPLFSQTM